jgi:hypothetical protein
VSPRSLSLYTHAHMNLSPGLPAPYFGEHWHTGTRGFRADRPPDRTLHPLALLSLLAQYSSAIVKVKPPRGVAVPSVAASHNLTHWYTLTLTGLDGTMLTWERDGGFWQSCEQNVRIRGCVASQHLRWTGPLVWSTGQSSCIQIQIPGATRFSEK